MAAPTSVLSSLAKAVRRGKLGKAFGTYEQTPGKGIGHLEELINAPYAERLKYTQNPMASWNRNGVDKMYSALGYDMLPSREMVGAFTPQGGTLEINPGMVGNFDVPMTEDAIASALRDMGTAESARAYVDAQNAGAGHLVSAIRQTPEDKMTSFVLDMRRSPTQNEMADIDALAQRYGFFGVDTGKGVSFINNPYSTQGEGRTAEGLAQLLEGEMMGSLPKGSEGTPVRIDSIYEPYESLYHQPGSGEATQKFLADMLANPEAAAKIEPELRSKAGANYLRDDARAKETGWAIREDIQRARRILLEGGIASLKRALESGVVLPAAAAAVLMPQKNER
jgi:hypothetical protein